MRTKGIILLTIMVLLLVSVPLFFMEEDNIRKDCYDKYSNIIENTDCYSDGKQPNIIGAIIIIVSLIFFFWGIMEVAFLE